MKSWELCGWQQASKAQVVQDLEGPSLLLQESAKRFRGLPNITRRIGAAGKPRTWSLDISFPSLHTSVATFLCLLGGNSYSQNNSDLQTPRA